MTAVADAASSDRVTLADAIANTLCAFDCGGDGTSPCHACQDEARAVIPTIIAWYAEQGIDLLEFRG